MNQTSTQTLTMLATPHYFLRHYKLFLSLQRLSRTVGSLDGTVEHNNENFIYASFTYFFIPITLQGFKVFLPFVVYFLFVLLNFR